MSLASKNTIDGTPISSLSGGSEKTVLLVCNDCGVQTKATYGNYLNSQIRHKRKGKTYCRPCSNKRTGRLKRGKPLHNACGPRPKMRLNNHPNYGGGRWVASDGYVMVQTGTRQYQREHLLIMGQHVGRRIRSEEGEVVHHINLDKICNEVSNLVILPSESDHRSAHRSLTKVAAFLVCRGLVKYVRESNEYVIDEATLRRLEEI